MLDNYWQELRQALRAALHRPAYAVLIVFILAVVIGASTTIFAVVDSVLLQALPYPQADRLMLIWDTHPERGIPQMNLSLPKVEDYRDRADVFEDIGFASGNVNLTLSGFEEPQRLTTTLVSPELLRLTGVTPVLGRIFTADENTLGGPRHAVILSEELWQGRFGGSATVIGRSITLSGAAYTVVGVLPRDFVDFPFPAQNTDIWVPAVMASEIYGVDMLTVRTSRVFVALGLLRPGVTRRDALAELQGINRNLAAAYPEAEGGWLPSLQSLRESYLGDLQPPLLCLAAGAVLLLVIGCANVTSLLLVRASRRHNELVTRLALGASRARLFRQAVIESLMLVVSGGALGMIAAGAGIGWLISSVPVEWPRHITIAARPAIFVAAFGITLAVGVLAATLSIAPGLRARASGVLPSSNRAVEPSGGALRRGLVVAEVAVAVTLLVGAGLTSHSFARLRAADVGFAPGSLAVTLVDVPADAHGPERLAALARELEEQVENVAGVTDGYIWSPQVPGESSWYTAVRPQDRPELRDDELPLVRFHYVGPGALEGIGLRFIVGRGISKQDTADGAGAIVLSESAARALWPEGDDPLGKVVRRWNRERWLTVVGITEDAKLSGRRGLGTDENLDVYFSFQQEPQNNIVVLARAGGNPGEVVNDLRDAVRAVLPELPTFDAGTLSEHMAEQEAIPRFTAMLATSFAATALFLATIGLYGLLAYTVCLRTREIGLRVALGAQPGRILRDVVRQGLRLAVIGVALGVTGALLVTRWLEALLFEVSPGDPGSFTAAALLLLAVAAAASLIPARRALRVQPQHALRCD